MSKYWLVVGTPRNWETAFDQGNIWGLKERTQLHLWDTLSENDTILFYATHPVSGIIGYGSVRTKFRQDKPLWPQEVLERKVIWKLRFEFDVEDCLPYPQWKTSKITSEDLKARARWGFQPFEEQKAHRLISSLQSLFKLEYVKKPSEIPVERIAEVAAPYVPSHDELKRRLVEIGKLQGFLAEKEYPVDIGRLDVVWRRVERSVPTYVFEVQIGGDLYHALAKLKHAFDLWNSHIFVVASLADYVKVGKLLSGTFHEIGSRLKFIELEKIEELYTRKRAYLDLEKELGI